MRYLMWDVDGTLLLTGGAGMDAMIKVIKDYYFLDAFAFQSTLAGRTDADIIKSVVRRLRGHADSAEAASLLIRYHQEIPHALTRHRGRVLKNVEKTLAYFCRPGSGWQNCLLTGNTRAGAQAKLNYYGLAKYFCFEHSVFGEISEERAELARIAFARFYLADQKNFSADALLIIGDTPNDAACALAIGARALILLDGSSYTREDFDACRPWKILDALPDDPQELERML